MNARLLMTAVAVVAFIATGCSNQGGDQPDSGMSKSSDATEQPKMCDSIEAAMDAVAAYQANRSHSFDAHTRKLSADLAAKARTAAAQDAQDVTRMAPALTALAASVDALARAASNGNERALRKAAGDYMQARVELDRSSQSTCNSKR